MSTRRPLEELFGSKLWTLIQYGFIRNVEFMAGSCHLDSSSKLASKFDCLFLLFCFFLKMNWVLLKIEIMKVQVSILQKHLFFYELELTHNIAKDCSLNDEFSTYMKIPISEHDENMLYTQIVFCFYFDIQNNLCTQHVLSLEFSCTDLVI